MTPTDEQNQAQGGGGDDPGPNDPNEPGQGQGYDPNDDNGSRLGFLTSKKVVALIVVIALVGMYLAYLREEQGRGTGNASPGATAPTGPNSVDGVDDLDDALHTESDDRAFDVPSDRDDPLQADGFVLHATGIFPSFEDTDMSDPATATETETETDPDETGAGGAS